MAVVKKKQDAEGRKPSGRAQSAALRPRFMFRLTEELRAKLDRCAGRLNVSVTDWIVSRLEQEADRDDRDAAEAKKLGLDMLQYRHHREVEAKLKLTQKAPKEKKEKA